jgi:hypothetical protein
MWLSFLLSTVLAGMVYHEWRARQLPNPLPPPWRFIPDLREDGRYCYTCWFALWYTSDWVEHLFGDGPCACMKLNQMWDAGWRPPRNQLHIHHDLL